MFERLEKRVIIKYKVKTLSDMSIGAHDSTVPGQLDRYVIKNSSGYPLIPGSSLKGVLRSEMERFLNSSIKDEQKVQDLVAYLFGGVINSERKESYASSIRFRDAVANSQRTVVRDGVGIDRKTRKVADGRNYEFEAVPEGTLFEGMVIIENPRIEQHKNAKTGAFLSTVQFFNHTGGAIGGGTSRGLGQVEIIIKEIREYTPENYLNGTDGTVVEDETGIKDDWVAYVKESVN